MLGTGDMYDNGVDKVDCIDADEVDDVDDEEEVNVGDIVPELSST